MKTDLKHVRRQTYQRADGTIEVYCYYRPTNTKLIGRLGSVEFIQSYAEAAKPKVNYETDTFAGLSAKYQISKAFAHLGASTRKERARWLRICCDKWGKVPTDVLTARSFRADVLEWQEKIAEKTPREADNLVSSMSQVCKYAHNKGLIDYNPLAEFPHQYQSNRANFVWSRIDVEKFCEFAPAELVLALHLALATGQRLGDLVRLRWDAFDGRAIRLRQGKTGARVTVPCTAELAGRLNSEPRRALTILTRPDGCPWPSNGLSKAFGRASREAGIKDLTFHDLRGTAITRLAEAGCSPQEIASISGHSFAHVNSILEKYCARTDTLAESAIAKLERRQ